MRNSIRDDDSLDSGFSIPRIRNNRRPIPDNYIDLEESEDEEEEEEEFILEMGCPYCSEGFDALGLCVHLEDQHQLETKSGVCPLCSANLGRNMISHLIIEHKSALKSLSKRKFHDDETLSIISMLRKKLQEEQLRSLQKESSFVASSTNVATDPLLLSFIYNPRQSQKPETVQLDSSAEPSSSELLQMEDTPECDLQADPFTRKEQEDKASKCEFAQTILFSAIFADQL